MAVPFPVDCGEKTLRRIAHATSMKRLLVSSRFRPRVEPIAQSLGITLEDELHVSPSPPGMEFSFPDVEPRRDLAAIMLTSGSTGESKGVMVTHRNIECNSEDIIHYLGLMPDDRTMAVLPFYYCYGTSLLHTHLMAGGVVGA